MDYLLNTTFSFNSFTSDLYVEVFYAQKWEKVFNIMVSLLDTDILMEMLNKKMSWIFQLYWKTLHYTYLKHHDNMQVSKWARMLPCTIHIQFMISTQGVIFHVTSWGRVKTWQISCEKNRHFDMTSELIDSLKV